MYTDGLPHLILTWLTSTLTNTVYMQNPDTLNAPAVTQIRSAEHCYLIRLLMTQLQKQLGFQYSILPEDTSAWSHWLLGWEATARPHSHAAPDVSELDFNFEFKLNWSRKSTWTGGLEEVILIFVSHAPTLSQEEENISHRPPKLCPATKISIICP